MLSLKDFKNCPSVEIDSFGQLIETASSLRSKDPKSLYRIKIKDSHWHGHIKFPFDGFFIEGPAEIEDDLYGREIDETGHELTTWKSPTFKLTGNDNIFKGLSFINSAGHPHEKGQQVAMAIFGDGNIFIDCVFSSTQDTLFAGPLPEDLDVRYKDFLPDDELTPKENVLNIFHNCKISGTVDYIFGAGGAIFDHCDLISLDNEKSPGWVAAPSHELKEEFGYLFNKCRFLNGGADPSSVYLARPWRDYGLVVVNECTYEDHINPLGFDDWVDRHHALSNPNNVDRRYTCRFYEFPYVEGRAFFMKNKKSDPLGDRYLEAIKKLDYLLK